MNCIIVTYDNRLLSSIRQSENSHQFWSFTLYIGVNKSANLKLISWRPEIERKSQAPKLRHWHTGPDRGLEHGLGSKHAWSLKAVGTSSWRRTPTIFCMRMRSGRKLKISDHNQQLTRGEPQVYNGAVSWVVSSMLAMKLFCDWYARIAIVVHSDTIVYSLVHSLHSSIGMTIWLVCKHHLPHTIFPPNFYVPH